MGGADADLILGHTLLEVKSSRLNDLRKRDLQQVVCYSLFDWDDAYGITEVAVLAARHGQLVRWPLEQLIASGSRGEHDLASSRAHVRAALLTR